MCGAGLPDTPPPQGIISGRRFQMPGFLLGNKIKEQTLMFWLFWGVSSMFWLLGCLPQWLVSVFHGSKCDRNRHDMVDTGNISYKHGWAKHQNGQCHRRQEKIWVTSKTLFSLFAQAQRMCPRGGSRTFQNITLPHLARIFSIVDGLKIREKWLFLKF